MTEREPENGLGRGSVWRRWDPHIHTPDTVLENRYAESDAWDQWVVRVEAARPRIEALGITDYASIDNYEEVLALKRSGRLPGVRLIFPNIELRYSVGTHRGSAINVHLLASPEDPNHVEEIRRLLSFLVFRPQREPYRCTRDDLIRLGRDHHGSALDDQAALRIGTQQFKVTPDNLRDALEQSEWARTNVLVGVAGGSSDGTSGLQRDGSLEAVRQGMEAMAHLIFSSQPSQQQFWLGNGSVDLDELTRRWRGPKPCIHGSDAHSLEQVGAPDGNRFTWIKGDATFEALRQACIEPGSRAIVSEVPPAGPLAYRTLVAMDVVGASWCSPTHIPLNQGLVGIIGARGSGKTALADLIAAGAYAEGSSEDGTRDRTFLVRAGDLLDGVRVRLTWADGSCTERKLNQPAPHDATPRVRYLSQQFVERLCSSEIGLTDELLDEIQRVIYEAHSKDGRAGTTNFEELLAGAASRGRAARAQHEGTLVDLDEQVSRERSKQASLDDLRKEQQTLRQELDRDRRARRRLIIKDSNEETNRLEAVSAAIERRRLALDRLHRQRQALDDLRHAAIDIRDRQLPSLYNELRASHSRTRLTEAEWQHFELRFGGDVEATLDRARRALEAKIRSVPAEHRRGSLPLATEVDLDQVALSQLEAESERLTRAIGLDRAKRQQLLALDAKIARGEARLGQLDTSIRDGEDASDRVDRLHEKRAETYAAVFDAINDEQEQLIRLYEPLRALLGSKQGELAKLSFKVRRLIDIDTWAAAGEGLLDLRTGGPFKGHGALLDAARDELLPAWRSGTSEDVAAAMTAFRDRYARDMLRHAPVPASDRARYWEWGAKVGAWLSSTRHVSVTYSIQYDGVDIEQLSPGTRGIVLLLLYLALDDTDDRPLIIDQPEENLDPKSIFQELVHRFKSARLRRQVIIVTHNANLIVNTDADQVIVATSGRHRPGQLPLISYRTGGLEDQGVRRSVCEILEGGEHAFKERARRLRVAL